MKAPRSSKKSRKNVYQGICESPDGYPHYGGYIYGSASLNLCESALYMNPTIHTIMKGEEYHHIPNSLAAAVLHELIHAYTDPNPFGGPPNLDEDFRYEGPGQG